MKASVRPTLPHLPLRNASLKASLRNIPSQPTKAVEITPDMQASIVFDMACIKFGQKNDALASACGVSGSLVSRWRSVEHRELPSIGQMFTLGPEFLRLFKQEQSRHFGWGKQALLDAVQALGEAVEEVG